VSGAGPLRVLVVGGGSIGAGSATLLAAPGLEFVETDVFIGPRTRVICDAHDLPFADGTFAAVVCQAVLEHVLDPWRVAEEIWRVLESDGYVYSEVPFMQQVHEGAFDFTRFTHVGHRRLWRRFDEIRSGAQGGPGMALVWSIEYFLRAPLPRPLWPLADRVASLAFFWLKYFDAWLVKRPGGLDAASGTFFLGRRRLTEVDDRSIVRNYRGGGPRLD
jgi:SAM-dependent methyltransferase